MKVGLDCQQRSKVGLTSMRNEIGIAELALDENDEHHHFLNVLSAMCAFSYFSNPLPPKRLIFPLSFGNGFPQANA